MKEFELKYGCNPNQKPSRILMREGGELPLEILGGRPGYINFLDALNSFQLVKELRDALGQPAAASFKHVSPAGAAIGRPLSEREKLSFFVDDIEGLDSSPLACAYARARGTDRMSSYGDFIALSDVCDTVTARIIAREVSDGVIAPGYTGESLALLRGKRQGGYNIIKIDKDYLPARVERKDVFGITFEQGRNDYKIDRASLSNIVTRKRELPPSASDDLMLALITLKYTQSNSVCYAFGGQTTGVGAGQQSRIHCTRLAGNKSDVFFLRQCDRVLSLPFRPDVGRPDRNNAVDLFITEPDELLSGALWRDYFTERPDPLSEGERREYLAGISGVSLGSDAFFPFSDNIDRAARSGVTYLAQPGGSIRDALVTEACDNYGIVMAMTGMRLFHH